MRLGKQNPSPRAGSINIEQFSRWQNELYQRELMDKTSLLVRARSALQTLDEDNTAEPDPEFDRWFLRYCKIKP